jgi:hypothetical protein
MMSIEAIRDRTYEATKHTRRNRREVMRRLDHGVWSAWPRHTLPESTWLSSIIPAITDVHGRAQLWARLFPDAEDPFVVGSSRT